MKIPVTSILTSFTVFLVLNCPHTVFADAGGDPGNSEGICDWLRTHPGATGPITIFIWILLRNNTRSGKEETLPKAAPLIVFLTTTQHTKAITTNTNPKVNYEQILQQSIQYS